MEIDRKIAIYLYDTTTYRFPNSPLPGETSIYPGITYPNYYTKISLDSHIASGTMRLTETLADSELEYGALFANTFECTLFNASNYVSNVAGGNYIEVVLQTLENGQISSEKRIFYGRVDSAKQDIHQTNSQITAYDMSYWVREQNVAGWWNGFWETRTSATLKELREGVLDEVGLPYESTTLVNDGAVIHKSDIQTYTSLPFEVIFKSISELTGTLPNIGRDGVLYWVDLTEGSFFESNDLPIKNTKEDISMEEYTTRYINGIKVYSSSSDLSQVYPLNTNPDNAYAISGNIILLGKSPFEIDSICQNLYNKIGGIHYTPASYKLIGDLDPEVGVCVGDMVTLNLDSGDYDTYVMTSVFSGVQLYLQSIDCKARGETREQAASSRANSFVYGNKFSKIEQDIGRIDLAVGELDNGEEIVSRINLTPGTVKIEAKNIDLSGTVTVQDLAGSGTTVINGDNITAGTISADVVDAANLKVQYTNIVDATQQAIAVANSALTLANINAATQNAQSASNFFRIGAGTLFVESNSFRGTTGAGGGFGLYLGGTDLPVNSAQTAFRKFLLVVYNGSTNYGLTHWTDSTGAFAWVRIYLS